MFELYNQDCIYKLKDIPSSSVSLVFCDLPYGITAAKWDSEIDICFLWEEWERIRKKEAPVVLFSSQPFTTKLINSNIKNFKYCWYWVKNQGTNFFHAKRMPIRKIEELCVFYKHDYYPQITDGHTPTNSAKGCSNGKAYYGTNTRNYKGGKTTRYPTNILEFKCVDNYSRVHSAEKPVDLCEYIIKTYTKEDEIVLDCCMGSGTTGVASIRNNRKFIGIEKDENYFNIAKKRVENSLTDDKDSLKY